MATVLKVNGTTVDRPAAHVRLVCLHLSLDGPDSLEFLQRCQGPVPSYDLDDSVELLIDGTRRFYGILTGVRPGRSQIGYVHGYTALGQEYRANRVMMLNPITETPRYDFNVPATDPRYFANLAGLTIEAMIRKVLEDHNVQLDALGIGEWDTGAIDPASDLDTDLDHADLDVTPPDAVTLAGEGLWNHLRQLLRQYCPNHALRIQPDGKIRIFDTFALTPLTLTCGPDPVDPPTLSRDVSGCKTAVTILGDEDVILVKLSTSEGTLEPTWDAAMQTAWSYADHNSPGQGRYEGTATWISATVIRFDPIDAAAAWASNVWGPSLRNGVLTVRNSGLTGVSQYEFANIVSNTALTAGGTSDLTVDRDITLTTITTAEVNGRRLGNSTVWKEYQATDADVAENMRRRFPQPVQLNHDNSAELISYPQAEVAWTESGLTRSLPFPMEVEPGTGRITFFRPTVIFNNTQAVLDAGGDDVVEPDDVILYAAVRKGNLTARYPSSGYSGTAFDLYDVEEVLEVLVEAWNNPGIQSRMDQWAEVLQKSLRDVVYEGEVTYHGLYSDALPLGVSLNVEAETAVTGGDPITTGLESVELPVRALTLEWPPSGPDRVLTTLSLSNRRAILSGDRLYTHGMRWEQPRPPSGMPEALALGGEMTYMGQTPGTAGPRQGLTPAQLGAMAGGMSAALGMYANGPMVDTTGLRRGAPIQAQPLTRGAPITRAGPADSETEAARVRDQRTQDWAKLGDPMTPAQQLVASRQAPPASGEQLAQELNAFGERGTGPDRFPAPRSKPIEEQVARAQARPDTPAQRLVQRREGEQAQRDAAEAQRQERRTRAAGLKKRPRPRSLPPGSGLLAEGDEE